MEIAHALCQTPNQGSIEVARAQQTLALNLTRSIDLAFIQRQIEDRTMIQNDLIAARLLRSREVVVSKPKNSEAITPLKRMHTSACTPLKDREKAILPTHAHLFAR